LGKDYRLGSLGQRFEQQFELMLLPDGIILLGIGYVAHLAVPVLHRYPHVSQDRHGLSAQGLSEYEGSSGVIPFVLLAVEIAFIGAFPEEEFRLSERLQVYG